MRNAKFLQKKSTAHQVTTLSENAWLVKSGCSQKSYVVLKDIEENKFYCDCDWQKYYEGSDCSHTVSVRASILSNARKLGVWASENESKRQHKKNEGNSNKELYFTSRV